MVDIVSAVVRRHINSKGVSLDKTAQAIGLGPRSLQRRIRQEGTTFRELVNHVIIGRAKELLQHGGMSVGEIAVELGYDSPQNFARAFKKIGGVTPTQFAASWRPAERRPRC